MALILGAALLTGGVILYILLPIIQGQSASLEREEDELTESEAKKRVRLLELRDVEYDYATGKLDESDYRSLKGEISREALEALRQVESGGQSTPHEVPDGGESDELEAEIAAVREALRQGRTCLTCGHVNAEGSRFCASCGAQLAAGAQAAPG
ncbi:MAG: c-type cytochrome biogenesis protein CcmI [Longimicrobiales bacterium]